MGTWSASITGNDTALDMIEEYKVAFSYFDVPTGLAKLDQFVRSNFDESDEDEWCAYFYSLAEFMWKNGILTDEIRDKAVQMVDSDFGMETWIEAGKSAVNQRRKALAKFREKIMSPQCEPKKIKLNHIYPDDIFEDGEVIAIQLKTAGKKYVPGNMCEPISDEEFLSYDNKYVIIQKAYSKEQHFCGVMPELCDRTAVFVLFKGIYDSPEAVDITKLEKADFKCGRSALTCHFEHFSSMFHFKKRGYKIIGKMEPLMTSAEEDCQTSFLNLGDNYPQTNADSRLIAAVLDYEVVLKEHDKAISDEFLADMVTSYVHWKWNYSYAFSAKEKDEYLARKAKMNEARKELYAACHEMLEKGAKVYKIYYAYPLGYAIKLSGEPSKILLHSRSEYKYWDVLEEAVRARLDI